MEERPTIPLARTCKIIRISIYTFLQQYQYFTSTSALLAFPFSASILLSQTLIPSISSPLLPTIYVRLHSLFDAAGFPTSSDFFSVLNLKLSQTISSSVFTLPFTLTFLLIAKASVMIQVLNNHKTIPSPPLFSSASSLYTPLLLTYICNSFLILSANATSFVTLFLAFNCLEGFRFSSTKMVLFLSTAGAVFYSIILANALIICNIALVTSGMERSSGGYLAILKACVMMRGRTSTALSLALPANLAMAAVEALFQYRVIRPYYNPSNKARASVALEGVFISYLYSILIVIDTIVSCMFYKSCKLGCWVDQEGRYYYEIKIAEDNNQGNNFSDFKTLAELP